MRFLPARLAILAVTGFVALASLARGADPTVEDALKLSPVQADVEFGKPSAADVSKCTLKSEETDGHTGWVVRDSAGQIIRRFVDTNDNGVVDLWCYFSHGIEVYRDIDANFNGKADQYRWLNTAGTRWGVDANEDGKIDQWKVISAEEVSAELVAALAKKDAARFERLLLSEAELAELGLGKGKESELKDKLKQAVTEFTATIRKQKVVAAGSEWVQFSAPYPGIVPAGTSGSTRDLIVYENVAAMVETGQDHSQVPLGTLIRVGDTWRLIGAPPLGDETASAEEAGFFFLASRAAPVTEGGSDPGGGLEKSQALLAELEKIDQQIQKASPEDQGPLEARRANVLEDLAKAAQTAEDRAQWFRQLADMTSAAVQVGVYPEGVDRLEKLFEELSKEPADRDLAGYVRFRHLNAWYGASVSDPNADFEKIQKKWLEDLEAFVTDYPQSTDAAYAMLQVAVAQEVAGEDEKAIDWYGRIVTDFPESPEAKKASGAKVRLESVGKPIRLVGKTHAGQSFDLSKLRGKVVLIHYWSSASEACQPDLPVLKELAAKYGKSGFEIVGVSFDDKAQNLADYLKTSRIVWPQLFEPGGTESRFANEMGILTIPTMILLDKKGNVVNRNIHVSELEREIKALLK